MKKPANPRFTDLNSNTGIVYKVLFWVSVGLLFYLSLGTLYSIIKGDYLDFNSSLFYSIFFFVFLILNLLKVFFNRSKFLYFAILIFFIVTCIAAGYNLRSFSIPTVAIPIFSSLYLAFFWSKHKAIKPNLFIKLLTIITPTLFFILAVILFTSILDLRIGNQGKPYYTKQNSALNKEPTTMLSRDIVLSFKDKYKDYLPVENFDDAGLVWAVNDKHTVLVSDPLVFSYSFTSYNSSLLDYFEEYLKDTNPNFHQNLLNTFRQDLYDEEVQKGFETDDVVCTLSSYVSTEYNPEDYISGKPSSEKYTTNIACVDKKVLNTAYSEQIEYLKAFPDTSEGFLFTDLKRVGDYVRINWNPKPPYMAGGFLMVAKKEPGVDNNVWNILYKGQQQPTCSEVEKYSIPYSLNNTCYDEEKEEYLCLSKAPYNTNCSAEDATVGFSKPRVFIDSQNLDNSTTNVFSIENGKPKLLSSNVDFIIRIEGEPNYILMAKTTNVADKYFPDGFYKSTDYEILNLKTKEIKSLKEILKNNKDFIDFYLDDGFYLEIAQRPSEQDFSKKPNDLVFTITNKNGLPMAKGLWFFDYKTSTFERLLTLQDYFEKDINEEEIKVGNYNLRFSIPSIYQQFNDPTDVRYESDDNIRNFESSIFFSEGDNKEFDVESFVTDVNRRIYKTTNSDRVFCGIRISAGGKMGVFCSTLNDADERILVFGVNYHQKRLSQNEEAEVLLEVSKKIAESMGVSEL